MKKLVATGAVAAALVIAPVLGGPVVVAPSALATTVNAGGGLWSYGTTGSDVYSNYHHPSKYHSSTACDNGVFQTCVQGAAAANTWSYASTPKSWLGGNTSYWNTY